MPIRTFPYNKPEKEKLFKQLVIDYLEGASIENVILNDGSVIYGIKDKLKLICKADSGELIDAKELCGLMGVLKNKKFDPQTASILTHLNVNPNIQKYTHISSLYHLLTHLRNEGHEHLEFLVELIDNTRVPSTWQDYLYGPASIFVSVCVLSYALNYVKPDLLPSAINWLKDGLPLACQATYHYFIQLHNLPLTGVFGQLILAAYYFYDTFKYGFVQSDNRLRHWLFRTAIVILNAIAHGISFWAAGSLPILPAVLFISSSLLDIFAHFYTYWQQPYYPQPHNPNSLHDTANTLRKTFIQNRDKHALLVRGIHATVVTLMITACYLLPGNIILSIAYTASIWVMLAIKDEYLNQHNQHSAHAIQKKLRQHYQSPDYNTEAQKKAEREAFNIFVNQKLESCQNDTVKTGACHTKMQTLKESVCFELEQAKYDFNLFFDHWDEVTQILYPTSTTNFKTPAKDIWQEQRSTGRFLHQNSIFRHISPSSPVGLPYDRSLDALDLAQSPRSPRPGSLITDVS